MLFLVIACAHAQGLTRSQVEYADPLTRRADSLIAILLEKEGSIGTGGDNVYAFNTDQALLDEITRLEGHAMPAIIDCLSDVRPSRMTYVMDGKRHALLRGAVCSQVAIGSDWGQQTRIAFTSYTADAKELLATRDTARAQFAALRARGESLLPRYTPSKVGCYSVQLKQPKSGSTAVDTARRLTFELDTLPLPATVRPTSIRIGPTLSVNAGSTWKAFFATAVEVMWGSPAEGTFLQLVFGRTDVPDGNYYVYRSTKDSIAVGGAIVPQRVPCR